MITPAKTNHDREAERLERLEMVVSEMDAQLHHVSAVVYSQTEVNQQVDDAPSDAPSSGERPPMRDEVWACENCCARLGIYNADKDELRVRYKDFVAYITPGAGGSIMVPCRRCGEQNQLNDTRSISA